MTGPNIFEYDNYRAFLKDYYQFKKTEDRAAFSFRLFSQKAGFSSPNFLKLVMDGHRNLTAESIDKFIKALRFNRSEGEFFRNLVFMNQAATSDEKQLFAEQMLRFRGFKKVHPLREAQFRYYTKWFYVPIREMVGSPHFQEDASWIASQVLPNISQAEASEALETLLQLGLVVRNSEGRLVQAEGNITTSDEVTSAAVAQFHREMMKRAGESIEKVQRSEREISSATLSVSSDGMRKIKKRLQEFRAELIQIASEDSAHDQVYQVNMQMFPVTGKLREKPKIED